MYPAGKASPLDILQYQTQTCTELNEICTRTKRHYFKHHSATVSQKYALSSQRCQILNSTAELLEVFKHS